MTSSRRDIDRDVLLRQRPALADVAAAARLLAEEVPWPRRVAASLVLITLVEVGATVGVALAGRVLLTDATAASSSVSATALLLAVLCAAVAFLAVRGRLVATERLALTCRTRAVRRLADNLQAAGVEDLSAVPMAGLREVLMTDVDAAYRFLLETLSQLTVLLFWVLASCAVVAWLSPPLLLLLTGLGAVCALGVVQSTRAHLRLTGDRFIALSALSQRARDVVEVERVVLGRQFGLGDLPVRQLMDSHQEFTAVAERQGRLTALVQAFLLGLNSLAFLAIVGFGAVLIADGRLAVGGLVAMIFVIGQLLVAVARLGETAARAAETATAGRRIGAYWSASPGAPEPLTALSAVLVHELSARGVGFRWDGGAPLLADVDLEVRRGRLASLTAATGAGKSTLAMLLTGLLPPQAGSVAVNQDAQLTPDRLPAGSVLYVGARPVLVEGSIRDNLLLDEDDPRADGDQVRALVEWVSVGALPVDVDAQVVGPHGTGLSSGQSQLVQLARAVWRDPAIVIFDEATSSLDMDTEAQVQARLLDWCQERVCLVVSHRRCPWTDAAQQQLTLVPDSRDPRALTVVDRTPVAVT